MARFQYDSVTRTKKSHGIFFSVLIFLFLCSLFYYGIFSVSHKADIEGANNLQKALTRGVIQCYTLEGHYPESLDYLEEYYGLTYDKDRFYIGYRLSGSNLMPDITVIERGTD